VGASFVRPEGSSLDSSFVYDLSFAFDAPPIFTIEMLVGLWNIPDRPMPQADSDLEMVPVLLSAQLQKEFAKFRAYLAVGGGYSFNNYALGGAHRQALFDQGAGVFSAAAENGVLYQGAVGAEFYSSESADLNFGVEVRYVGGDVDFEENLDGVVTQKSTPLNLWLVRGSVTWHF
jgi:outer membrane protein W